LQLVLLGPDRYFQTFEKAFGSRWWPGRRYPGTTLGEFVLPPARAEEM
jgi:hypothetical protein